MELALSGDGPTPWSWFISQLCESFTCTPMRVLLDLGYQLDAVPWPLMTEILEFRSYRNIRDSLLRAEHDNNRLDGQEYDRVREIRAQVQRVQLGLPLD